MHMQYSCVLSQIILISDILQIGVVVCLFVFPRKLLPSRVFLLKGMYFYSAFLFIYLFLQRRKTAALMIFPDDMKFEKVLKESDSGK